MSSGSAANSLWSPRKRGGMVGTGDAEAYLIETGEALVGKPVRKECCEWTLGVYETSTGEVRRGSRIGVAASWSKLLVCLESEAATC
jgi:hypothetical protein